MMVAGQAFKELSLCLVLGVLCCGLYQSINKGVKKLNLTWEQELPRPLNQS